jgi:hypothetical protein
MALAGVCEAGVWRERESAPAPAILPLSPDPRFPPERQAAYLVRGHHADDLGLHDGDVLTAVDDGPVRDGDIVISRRVREGGASELAARLVENGELRARPGVSLSPKLTLADVQIVGRVIFAHRIFGS